MVVDKEALAAELRARCQPWRAMIIGIDGRDGEGKSTLARYLAWQLGMPAIETDVFVITETGQYDLRFGDLMRAIETRLKLDRPVIVEGIFLLQTLTSLNLSPDVLIYVQRQPPRDASRWAAEFKEYDKTFEPQQRAEYLFAWQDPDHAGH